MGRFDNKVAFITGSAQGLGQQFAIDLAKEGATVVISDLSVLHLAHTCEMLDEIDGQYLALSCDVTSVEAVNAAFATMMECFGRCDILINNAGLLKSATIEETSLELLDQTIDVNIKGVAYCIMAATPIMKEQRYGRIVNIASITGKNGDNSTTFIYGGSKGAVITMTRSVARQLGPWNITCNSVAPHAVMTEMMAYWSEERKAEMASKIPLRRLSTQEDVSHLTCFLASDEASFITGETININGGYYMD